MRLFAFYFLFSLLFSKFTLSRKVSNICLIPEEAITLDGIDNEVSWGKASMVSDEFNGLMPIPEIV